MLLSKEKPFKINAKEKKTPFLLVEETQNHNYRNRRITQEHRYQHQGNITIHFANHFKNNITDVAPPD